MEYVPRLMCTQHPDSTVKVSVQEEVIESIQAFTMYGCDEVMVDYEGKLTPYAQPKEIVLKASSLGIPIGEKLFITPRVPNPRLEDLDRVSLSIEAALLANYYSYTWLGTQAVKWIILPMVEDPAMVRLVQRLIVKKMRVYQEEFSIPKMDVQLVPLVEDVERFLEIHRFITILYNAVKDYGIEMHNLRVFIGKSDAAVKAGHIASSIGVVLALYKTLIVDKELDLDIKPIIGMGMPTFRGGINNPTLVEHEVRCYQGFRTVTIQSAIRYDNPFEKYRKVYTVLNEWIDKPARAIDEGIATRIIKDAMSSYRKLVSRYLEVVNRFSERIPSTRERVSWREYGRRIELGDKLLNVPRAIVFTATWYTLGVPPTYLDAEYIINAYRSGEIDEVLKLTPQLLNEWRYELQFYIPSVASKRLDEHIVKVINEALDYMGLKPEPNELYKSIAELEPIEYYILALASIRGFLG